MNCTSEPCIGAVSIEQMALLQSPTLSGPKTQPSSCQSAYACFVSNSNQLRAYRMRRNARGSRGLSKQTRTTATLNEGSGDYNNANSGSAAELRSSQNLESTAAASEGILDLLLQTAELLLILGVAGTQAGMLLSQWQQQQHSHQEEGQHTKSMHKHQVLIDPCALAKGTCLDWGAAIMLLCLWESRIEDMKLPDSCVSPMQEVSTVTEAQLPPPIPNAVLSSGMQLVLALALFINWLLQKRVSLRYSAPPCVRCIPRRKAVDVDLGRVPTWQHRITSFTPGQALTC